MTQRVLSPIGLTALVFIMFVALMAYGFTILIGAGLKSSQATGGNTTTTTSSNSSGGMNPSDKMQEMGGLITLIIYDK